MDMWQGFISSTKEWIPGADTMKESARDALEALRAKALKVARAWMHKELVMELWWKRPRENIEADWRAWCRSAAASRLQPIIKVQRTIRMHLQGIVNAIAHQATNARSESINGRIQHVKSKARGFRNAERFRNAIYFHLGGLPSSDL